MGKCDNIQQQGFKALVECLGGMINLVIPVIIGFALLLFLFGLVKYITAGGDEKQVKEARTYIIFGIVALFVMVSVWGLVGILVQLFFGGDFNSIPQIK